MRRTMAMHFIEAGPPYRLVQKLGDLGEIRMAERYTRQLKPQQIDPERAVMKILDFPLSG